MTNNRDTDAPASRAYHQGQWRPVSAELLRTILTEPGGPPQVGGYDTRRWASAASASERGQQHVRVALAFAGDAPDLDSPELFDRVADTIPQIAADLHALALRLGFDPERLGLLAEVAQVAAHDTNSTTEDDEDKDL
jgi:hypothetical protein